MIAYDRGYHHPAILTAMKLPILHYPDPRLRQHARPVPAVDATIQRLLDDMLETMYAAAGIGLAAIQVALPWRMVVIDISETRDQPLYLVNPEILTREGVSRYEEGCLSVPDTADWVTRAAVVTVRALDYQGQPLEFQATGLLATCVQHELDHLDGKLFVDHLSSLKRERIRHKLLKRQERQRMAPKAPISFASTL